MDEVATVSNGLDRGRVYVEEQAILLRHGNTGVNVEISSAEQSIIVHEQSQPPWVPSRRRLGLCSYKDNEGEARVGGGGLSSPLRDRGGSARAHEAQSASHCSPLLHEWTDVLSRPPHRHWYAAGRIFRSGHCPESGIRPGKHDELSSNNDVNDTVDIGGRMRETSTSFETERLICASHLLLQPRIR